MSEVVQMLKNKFSRLGAVCDVQQVNVQRNRLSFRGLVNPSRSGGFSIDVRGKGKEEKFEIRISGKDSPAVNVLDIQPELRHLLLMVEDLGIKYKMLCGHDERHWFVSPIADRKVSTVVQAIENLKPSQVVNMQHGVKLSKRIKNTHRNKTSNGGSIVRQGEWFFIPTNFNPNPKMILKNEPLQRSAGNKPHMCEELYRSGGETVYVLGGRQLTQKEHIALSPENKKQPWRPMTANALIYVRGRISHPDHATVRLASWHQAQINNEAGATGMIRYLD